MTLEELVEKEFGRLPSTIKKNGKNYKIVLKAILKQLLRIDEFFQELKDIDDIDKAYGNSLNRIGDDCNVLRKNYSDEKYRRLIKATENANTGSGNIASIKTLLAIIFDCEEEEFVIEDIETAKFKILLKSHISISEAYESIELCRAAGVGFSIKVLSAGKVEVVVSEGRKRVVRYDRIPFVLKKEMILNDGIILKKYVSNKKIEVN